MPLSSIALRSRYSNSSPVSRRVPAAITTVSASAKACRRAARQLCASPLQRFGVDKLPVVNLIVCYVVNYSERLDRTFAALVDPTRRAILARLERETSASVSELARPFAIKLPAVMKHLDVLDKAGLITRSKIGRTVTVRLLPEPIREAMDWLRRYERFWSARLDRLAAYAEGKEAEMQEKGR
jgi:DNA-binding transcriptional ArsR family regulator